jgi:hypothetical protein
MFDAVISDTPFIFTVTDPAVSCITTFISMPYHSPEAESIVSVLVPWVVPSASKSSNFLSLLLQTNLAE